MSKDKKDALSVENERVLEAFEDFADDQCCFDKSCILLRYKETILKALALLDAVESGKVKVVPVEPTDEIMRALRASLRSEYKAAIKAAPPWEGLVKGKQK